MTRNRLISAGNVVDASLPCRRRDTVHSPEVERQQERERERAVLEKKAWSTITWKHILYPFLFKRRGRVNWDGDYLLFRLALISTFGPITLQCLALIRYVIMSV